MLRVVPRPKSIGLNIRNTCAAFFCRPLWARSYPIYRPYSTTTTDQSSDQFAHNSSDKFNFQAPSNRDRQVSCTIVNENGQITAVSKKFSRTEFLADNGLHPRDLRNISQAKVSIIPSILVRENCMLVNMLELQAVIKHNQVLILDDISQADTSRLSVFIYDLEAKLRLGVSSPNNHHEFNAAQTYELKALESILMNSVSGLELKLKSHISVLNGILNALEDHVDRELLKELLTRSKGLSQFYQRSKLVRDVMSDLLDNDEDLSEMYLTEKFQGIHRDEEDHAEAELLLEAYYKHIDEIVQQAERVMTNIKTTEEIINIMLDANRNSLMLLELKITISMLGFTIGMFFSALYGMNLENFIEESPYGFVLVSSAIAAVSMAVTWFNFRHLLRAQKITMGSRRRSIGTATKGRSGRGVRRFLWNRKMRNIHYSDPSRRDISWKWLVDKGGSSRP